MRRLCEDAGLGVVALLDDDTNEPATVDAESFTVTVRDGPGNPVIRGGITLVERANRIPGGTVLSPVRLRLPHPCEDTGLGEQCEPVGHAPVLDDAAVHDACLVEHQDVDVLMRRRPEKGPGVRPAPPDPHPH